MVKEIELEDGFSILDFFYATSQADLLVFYRIAVPSATVLRQHVYL